MKQLLALADQTSDAIMEAVVTSAEGNKTWPTLIRDITHTYLSFISTRPQLMRALYIGMAALGEEGVQMRREVQDPMTLAPAAEALIQRVTECKSVS